MGDTLSEMSTAAAGAAIAEAPAFENVQATDPISGTGTFSEEEKRQIEEFASKIDIQDTKTIISYGGGVQKQMADFSESVLQNVKTHDLGEVGQMLTGVISDLKDFNPGEEEKGGGFFGFFKKQGKKIEEIRAGYDKAAVNVDKVAQALQQHQITLLKDVDMLDRMYASNLTYYKQLTMYIAAGKKKIADVREKDLPAAKLKAEQSGLAEDAQAAKDLEDQLTRFEKKIHDLELTRAVALQTAPQIRMIQNNDTIMVEKIQSTIVNTIPLWKNQMVLALGLSDSLKAAKAENEVTDMTNRLLMQNAEKLKQTTIETAKASERGIVDMETLKKTNESLISTLDEVAKIQTEGRAKRAQAEVDLRNMEDELRHKLLSMQPTVKPAAAAPAKPAAPIVDDMPKPETFDPFSTDDAPWMK
ncbi:MAG: toxic anion resistance protein [Lachnospiraceae bacterium]|nr:toxic anion resistance protein [Lachnospiraceae bacterium]